MGGPTLGQKPSYSDAICKSAKWVFDCGRQEAFKVLYAAQYLETRSNILFRAVLNNLVLEVSDVAA